MHQSKNQATDNKWLSQKKLLQIFDNLPDPIFVTDSKGNIILSNSTTATCLGLSLGQLMATNVFELVQNGFYDITYAGEAIKRKCKVSGLIKMKTGMLFLSTSTPVLDDFGNVVVTITTSRPKELIAKYIDDTDGLNIQRKREVEYLRSHVLNSDDIVAESKQMRQLLVMADVIARAADSTVMLYGESGTGKEVLAKFIHLHSKRADAPLIAVNCATLPENLFESELFGYEKGTFTGANAEGKIGLMEAANGGTLFLDEIAELPFAVQAKLLRVLETGEIRRLGSTINRKVDFRLITATHKNLKQMSEEGTFRNDLFYRLNVIPLSIPPLRERPEDILALANKFINQFGQKYGVKIELSEQDGESLLAYHWPGNVREIRNEMERRIIYSMQDEASKCAGLMALSTDKQGSSRYLNLVSLNGSLKTVLHEVEAKYILQIVESCNGQVSKASELLGIRREVLHRKLKALKIKNNIDNTHGSI